MNKSVQKGMIDPKIIIGGVVVLVIIFFLSTGNLKFSASINKNSNQPSSTTTSQEQSSSNPEPTAQPKTYQNDKYGLSLEYPANWSLKENPAPSYIAGFFSPKEDASDTYDESVGVKAIDTSSKPDLTLQEVVDTWENQTKKSETSFVVTDRKSATIAEENAKDIFYTFQDKGIDGKGFVRIALKNNTAYIFTYNAAQKSYDKFLVDAEATLNSVKF